MSGPLQVTLRPPSHRDFLSGYPGIPSSDPANTATPVRDPLVSLPIVLRPQAHLSGTVDVRTPTKGTKARFLRVELEKIETLPPPSLNYVPSKKDIKDGVTVGRFVELIGSGPGTLWEAGGQMETMSTRKKRSVMSVVLRKDSGGDDEDGVEAVIPEREYPFRIPLPEGLPPTTEVDSKGSGISYQLVVTLCCRGKKALLKSSPKYTLVRSVAAVVLNKADILPTWPAYAPLLPHPTTYDLPWARESGPTTGEKKYSKATIKVGGSDGNAGDVWIEGIREASAFGPGDEVEMSVQIGWEGDRPIRLTRLDLVLRETILYRYPPSQSPSTVTKNPPKVNTIFSATTSVSPDPSNSASFAILHRGEPARYSLSGTIPSGHSRVTVQSAKHIVVQYHFKLRALFEGGEEVSIDQWRVTIGGVGHRVAKGLMEEIGWVEGLCDRPHVEETTPTHARSPILPPKMMAPVAIAPRASSLPRQFEREQSFSSDNHHQHGTSVSPDFQPPPPPHEERHAHLSAAEEKQRLYRTAKSSSDAVQSRYHVQNPSPIEADTRNTSVYSPSIADTEPRFFQAERTGISRATSKRVPLRDSVSLSPSHAPSIDITPLSKYDQAKALAKQRQQAALLELERQNKLLEEMENEEVEETERETQAIRARVEEVERRRRELEARRRGAGGGEEQQREVGQQREVQYQRRYEEKANAGRQDYARPQEPQHVDVPEQHYAPQVSTAQQEEEARQNELRVVGEQRRAAAEKRREIEQARQAEAALKAQVLRDRVDRQEQETRDLSRMGSVNQFHSGAHDPNSRSVAAQYDQGAQGSYSAPGIEQANSSFYANAIANSGSLTRSSTSAQDKSAYLQTLRQQDEARRTTHASPATQRQYSVDSQPSEHSQATSPQPSYPPRSYDPFPNPIYNTAKRSNDYHGSRADHTVVQESSAYPSPPSTIAHRGEASHEGSTSAPTISSQPEYKTAREEKEDLERRRREADVAEQQRRDSPSPGEDGLPTYQGGGESASLPSASEEKQAISAYHAARAAVENNQRLPPPARRQSISTSQPVYESNQQSHSSLHSVHEASPVHSPRSQPAVRQSSQSSEVNERDPEISAGKQRRVDPGQATTTIPGQFPARSMSFASAPPMQTRRQMSYPHIDEPEFGTFSLADGMDYEAELERQGSIY